MNKMPPKVIVSELNKGGHERKKLGVVEGIIYGEPRHRQSYRGLPLHSASLFIYFYFLIWVASCCSVILTCNMGLHCHTGPCYTSDEVNTSQWNEEAMYEIYIYGEIWV